MKEQWDLYLDWSYKEFFSGIPVGSNVIEIGPGYGFHSQLIQKQKPTHHRVIEPGVYEIERLKDIGCEVITKHYQDFYSERRPADVVVCCGVLYHILTPLDLIEKITNLSRPDRIIISNIDVNDDGMAKYTYKHDVLGRPDRMLYEKPIKYWQKLKSGTLSNIMKSQGYNITKQKTTKDIWDKYVYYWQEYERT